MVSLAAAAVLLSSTAFAGEWSGFYIGGVASADFAHAGFALPGDTGDRLLQHSANGTSFVGGGLVGYNFQVGNAVIGAEADLMSSPGTRSVTACTVPDGCFTSAHDSFTTFNDLHTSTSERYRVRFGMIAYDTLFYGAAGYSHTTSVLSLIGDCFDPADPTVPTVYNFVRAKSLDGLNLAVGAEHSIGKHLFVRGEYLYEDFGNQTWSGQAPEWNDRRISLNDSQLRLAVGLRL
ncbi:MAG TPA: outer membrane beta-barrel protein [Steroidobacteraceae bacterium]|jgi:outer membrane immunogenic protein|nr:outer membrane beta-barrel protein [Steroidobacteraceae bacterium]